MSLPGVSESHYRPVMALSGRAQTGKAGRTQLELRRKPF